MPKNDIIKKTSLIPTVLVSNGISYLGLHLCAALLEKGARVIVIDRVDAEVRARAKELLANPNFALFNVEPDKGLPEKIHSVDYVFALTFPDDPASEKRNLVSEAFGVKNLLDLAVKSDAKFGLVEPLFSLDFSHESASHDSAETPGIEDYSYEKNSSFLRSLIWDYIDQKKLNGRIVRLCNVYGPGMPFAFSVGLSRFLYAVLENNDLYVHSDGVRRGYYLHVEDAVEGIVKALFYKRTSGRVFKLLSRTSHADLEVAFVLKSLANTELNLKFTDQKVSHLKYDTGLGESVPRWEQEYSLKEGLAQTLEGFGYEVNSHAFKPAKVIEDKLKERSQAGAIHSLLNLKEESKAPVPSVLKGYSSKSPLKSFSRPKRFALHFPRFKLPQLPSLKLPKISAFSFGSLGSFGSLFGFDRANGAFSTPRRKALSLYQKTGLLLSLALFMFFVAAPLAVTAISTRKALEELEDVSVNMLQLQTAGSKSSAKEAFSNLHRAKNAFKKVRWLFAITGTGSTFASLDNTFEAATYFTGSLYRVSKALDPFSTVWEVLKPTSSATYSATDFKESSAELSFARKTLDLALANYKKVDVSTLPKPLRARVSKLGEALNSMDSTLTDAIALSSALPDVLGVEEEKEYLLLFQNSNEVRPTGGFIGSYAVLSLEDGKITELNIDDIYNPDGQIDSRGIVSEVPAPIEEFLGEDILHIRNANWNPDFPESVQTIENLFFKLDGRDFDGVVAVDLNFVRRLLEVTGPVFLAAYNEEVNADNIYERAQYYSEFDYQEGISSKRSFLTVLSSKLLESIFSLPPEKFPDFVSAVYASLEGREFQLVMDNVSLSEFLGRKHWDGSQVNSEGDYLMIVNANLGGTKANYFTEESYDYSVTSDTRDGVLRSHLTLSYKHNGQDNAWPGGPYTNYFRVYVPKGAKLTGGTQTLNQQVPQNIFEQLTAVDEEAFTVFAGSFVLQPQDEIRLQLDYDLPQNLSLTKEKQVYSLYWQKQAGTSEDLFRFNFKGPFGTSINGYKPQDLVKQKNIASLEGYLGTDKEIEISLK